MSTLMKIVVLTGYYYPNMYPPAACIDKYIQELKKNHTVHIVCQKSAYKYKECNDSNISFHAVSNWTNDLRNYANYCILNSKKKVLFQIVLFFIRLFGVIITPFVYPSRLYWLKQKYYEELNNINSSDSIDVIISVSMPTCAHLAAMKFKKEHPNVKWITYSTDPFTFYDTSYHGVIFKKNRKYKNFKTELDYYNSADINILTEELYDSALNDFHVPKQKLLCFPYVLKEIKAPTSPSLELDGKIKIVYAGALNSVIRNPEYTLSVLSKVDIITLYLFQSGDCDSILRKYSSNNIRINGLVKRDNYLSLISKEADILLNIGNNSDLQAPSKMLELLSTGKPIIKFYFKKDNQYRMIEKYPLGLNIGRNEENAIDKVYSFCKSFCSSRMTYQEVEKMFPENCLKNQLEILDKAMLT